LKKCAQDGEVLTVRSTVCSSKCRSRKLRRIAARDLHCLAVNLRALRIAAGLTVRELAGRAGISNGYVPMMEAAKLRDLPSPAVLKRLARALGTTVDALRA
jgi:hypothetical protein